MLGDVQRLGRGAERQRVEDGIKKAERRGRRSRPDVRACEAVAHKNAVALGEYLAAA